MRLIPEIIIMITRASYLKAGILFAVSPVPATGAVFLGHQSQHRDSSHILTGPGVTVEWGPPQMGTQGPYNFKNIGDPVPIMLTF